MTKTLHALCFLWAALPAAFAATLAPNQVTVSASQYSTTHVPANVINRSGMVSATAHNNDNTQMWLSQPDGDHAITFQFDDIYTINQLRVWNYNQPGAMSRGMRHVTIEYSRNGYLWSQLYGDYEIPQASGAASLSAATINARGVKARFIRLVPHPLTGGSNAGNWGYTAQNHVGLSEIEFDVATSDILSWNPSNMAVSADGQVSANQAPLYAVNGAGLGTSGLLHDNAPNQTTWLSAGQGQSNPHPGTRAGKAWIKFAFNQVRKLRSMRVWNYGDPAAIANGLKNVTIEYSTDNRSWMVLPAPDGSNIHTFQKSTGADDYANETLVNFLGREARYVVITAESTNGNWGGSGWGLGEVRFRSDSAVGMTAFCGVGDHIWVPTKEPGDSVPAVAAMFEWMADTYGIRRMYWRDSSMWIDDFTWGKESALYYDHHKWEKYLKQSVPGYATIATDAAREYGMESWLYAGLFEAGLQPDVGIVKMSMFEDNLRVTDPEVAPLNRWGNRRQPGMLSFCYPEVRAALIDRYLAHMISNGYDGVNFYTYVENTGLRYEHEFGFEQPIINEFNKLHPGVDLKQNSANLTALQREDWYKCQGKFVTQFLSEMKTALRKEGMKLSIILDPVSPDYAQVTWGNTIRATGNIYLDWKKWIADGLIDEIWVQLATVSQQKALLNQLLPLCANKPVKLVVRTTDPLGTTWNSYRTQGVNTIAVITAESGNGIEKYSLSSVNASTLNNGDWKVRLQTLSNIAKGTLTGVSAASVAPLVKDRHVLVRRMAVKALKKLGASGQASAVIGALSDPEPSVRNAAADALAGVPGPASITAILEALATDDSAPFKVLCYETLNLIASISDLNAGLAHSAPAVREVCVRTLYKWGPKSETNADQALVALRGVVNNASETDEIRYWALYSMLGMFATFNDTEKSAVLGDCLKILGDGGESSLVQLEAAHILEYLAPYLTSAQKNSAATVLTAVFKQYGEGSLREDAAYGWRMVGNALTQVGGAGALIKIMDPQVQGITAEASSANSPSHQAVNTINGSGLTDDKHNSTNTDMWLSGTTGGNWIKYTFNRVYKLEKMQLWNYNQNGFTTRGIRNAKIEYSTDNQNWTVLQANYPFTQAPGTNGYLHADDVFFNGVLARYVRITPATVNGNWGFANQQVGISEVIFNLDEKDAGYPLQDYHLSWLAYQVLYEKQERRTMNGEGYNLVAEADDIRDHNRYAPSDPSGAFANSGGPGSTAPLMTGAASRFVHAGGKTVDRALPLNGTAVVEPRRVGASGAFKVVLSFDKSIVSGAVSLVGSGAIVGEPAISGSQMTVNLTGLSDGSTVRLNVSGVTGFNGSQVSSGSVRFQVLQGDVTGDGKVDASDVQMVKDALSPVMNAATNGLCDLDGNGLVNTGDVLIAKSRMPK